MSSFCPVSDQKINVKAVRVSAILVTLILSASIAFQLVWVFPFLIFDFYIRAFTEKRWSLLKVVSTWMVDRIGLKPEYANAGPKIFANRVGFVFSSVSLLLFILGLPVIAQVFAGVFAVCTALEGFFGYCLGCQMYSVLLKMNDYFESRFFI